VSLRLAALAALTFAAAFGQTQLRPDDNDPVVVRARENLEQVKKLVAAGALPALRLEKAQQDILDAMDSSVLKQSLYSKDLLPEQTDQMVEIAERMVVRRERALQRLRELVDAGVISPIEVDSSGTNLANAQRDLDLAQERAKLVAQIAESVRLEKAVASMENEAESHPEWIGSVYTKYDGSGIFTPLELATLKIDFAAKFYKQLPISADGQTAVHTALGFDHRGRVDVALNPDQPEGQWLMKYLQAKKIPYFAFRAAVPHKATGAHIHLGPQSTRLAATD
jgi:DNA-binding Lrp family transcriptional regulator